MSAQPEKEQKPMTPEEEDRAYWKARWDDCGLELDEDEDSIEYITGE